MNAPIWVSKVAMSKYCAKLLTFPPSPVRRRDGLPRRVQWARVRALPDHLNDRGIANRVLTDERRLRVRDGLGPALPDVEDLPDPLHSPAGGLLIIDTVLGEPAFTAFQFLSLYAVVVLLAVSKTLDISTSL